MGTAARWMIAGAILAVAGLAGTAGASAGGDAASLAAQVREREQAFARTMADRDHAAFAGFVSEEALFFGSKKVLRGRAAVSEGWKGLYEGKDAPFSWEPEQVEVLDSGTLALSTGPVRDPQGKTIGTFQSIWRREADGQWRVVFDKGCPPCNCPAESH